MTEGQDEGAGDLGRIGKGGREREREVVCDEAIPNKNYRDKMLRVAY